MIAEIDGALEKIRESFHADLCGLYRVDPQSKGLFLSHVAATGDTLVIPEKVDCAPRSPWRFPRLLRGEMILVRTLDELPKETMDAPVCYNWPGKVRELRNLIEQASIVSPGDLLVVRQPEALNQMKDLST